MTVYIICAMFNDTVMYVVGQGNLGFKTKESAREYFEKMEQDWTVTHYEIREMELI